MTKQNPQMDHKTCLKVAVEGKCELNMDAEVRVDYYTKHTLAQMQLFNMFGLWYVATLPLRIWFT